MLFMIRVLPSAASLAMWASGLAVRILARSLQMPEPVLHDTGVFVFAQVQAAETRVAKTFCPIRLLRRLRARFDAPRRAADR